MTAAERNKGAAAERRFVKWLREHGYPDARRYLTEGGKTAENRGDIDAIPAVCFDVKDRADCKPGTWMRQAEEEAGPTRLPIVIYWPPRDGEWIAMLRVTELLRLLEDDGRDLVPEIPMDPESNWDICPACLDWLHGGVPIADWPFLDDFPGIKTMRDYHEEHKRREGREVPK